MAQPGCYLDISDEIAKGASGTVFRVVDPEVGANIPIVLKKVNEVVTLAPLEIDTLFRLRHPNLLPGLRLYIPPTGDACFNQDQVGLVLPAMDRTGHEFAGDGSTSWRQRFNVFLQICEGLRFLHANGICHFDLKLANTLVRATPMGDQAVVADYGLCRVLGMSPTMDSNVLLITVNTRPVENLAGSHVFGYRSDVWSLALVGLELLSQQLVSLDPMFYVGILAAYQAGTGSNLVFDPAYWSADLITAISRDSQLGDQIQRFGLEYVVRRHGSRSPWFDPRRRKAYISNLIGANPNANSDDPLRIITNILYSMLSMDPLQRPTTQQVCDMFGVIPMAGTTAVAIIPRLPEGILGLMTNLMVGVNQTFFAQQGVILPQVVIDAAMRLFQRCLGVQGPVTDASLRFLALTCLWIVAKMFGHSLPLAQIVLATRDIEPWDYRLTEDPSWYLVPWTPGQPLIPSSLLVMERLVIQTADGVLL